MNARRILAILKKDLRDAWRDGRIIVLLLMPIGIALIPSLGGDEELPFTEVAVVEQAGGGVARELREAAGKSVEIELEQARDSASARELVAEEEVEFAVVVASGAEPPRAEVLVGADATPAAQSAVALVPDALARAAGRTPAARTQVRAIAPADDRAPIDVLEPDTLSVLLAIVLLVAFVAMMIVPIQTAEELETGTFGALRLAATGSEILTAKALAGFVFGSAGVGLVVLLTRLDVHDPVLFFGAALALIVSLVGFGLLLGLLIPNSNAINTYAGFLIFPLVVLAAAVFFVESGVFATILDVLPFAQASKLMGDGVSAETPFGAGPVAWLVIAGWAVAGYAVLVRIASRREL